MTAVYEIRIYSRAGVRFATLTGTTGNPSAGADGGYTSLSYTKEVNAIGSGSFSINADSSVVDFLDPAGVTQLDAQVEIFRSDSANSIANYVDFYGLLRDREYTTDDNGIVTFTAYLEEQSDFLRRGSIAYRANVANRSLFSAASTRTILETLVTYNATSAGTTGDGRDRTVDSWGANITVSSGATAGTTQTKSCMGRNLYEVLKEVAEAGGLDFKLTKTGAQAWQFTTVAMLGTDRSTGSSKVTFSLPRGNMRRPSLRSNHRAERTVVTAGGQQTDSDRVVRTRTGTNYNALYNSYELFINASQYTTNAGLDAAADERLKELEAHDTIAFDVIQVPSTLYGKHYFLGDKVSAYFLGKTYTPQVRRVNVDVRQRGNQPPEQIQIMVNDG